MSDESLTALVAAVRGDNVEQVRRLLAAHPNLKARIDDALPGFSFDSTALVTAVSHHNREMIGVLLDAGANINVKSGWWAGGFGVLDSADAELVPYLIERGAVVDAHAAARLGMVEKLEALISADPAVAHARGGDGQTALHFASTVEVARVLLDRGAD